MMAGCSLIPDDRFEFTGSWLWFQSYGGFGGITMTPETDGFEEQLIFFGGRFYIIMRDKKIVQKGEYTVTK